MAEGDACSTHHFSLFNISWKPIQEEPLLALWLIYLLFNHFPDELVIHQLTCIHHCFHFLPQGRSRGYYCTKHVPWVGKRKGGVRGKETEMKEGKELVSGSNNAVELKCMW